MASFIFCFKSNFYDILKKKPLILFQNNGMMIKLSPAIIASHEIFLALSLSYILSSTLFSFWKRYAIESATSVTELMTFC